MTMLVLASLHSRTSRRSISKHQTKNKNCLQQFIYIHLFCYLRCWHEYYEQVQQNVDGDSNLKLCLSLPYATFFPYLNNHINSYVVGTYLDFIYSPIT